MEHLRSFGISSLDCRELLFLVSSCVVVSMYTCMGRLLEINDIALGVFQSDTSDSEQSHPKDILHH